MQKKQFAILVVFLFFFLSIFQMPAVVFAADSSIASTQYTTKLSNASDGIKVTWNPLSHVDSYEVFRKEGNGSFQKRGKASGNSFIDSQVTSGTVYTYYVKAVSGSEEIVFKEANLIRLNSPKTSVSNCATGVKVSWTTVNGASQYEIYRKTDGAYQMIHSSNDTSYIDMSVVSGTSYTYYVRAVSGNVKSGYASKRILYLKNTVTSVSNTSAGVSVKWSSIDGAEQYKIYRKENGKDYQCIKTADKNTLSFVDHDVTSGIKYYYYVKSYSGTFSSGYSYKTIVYLDPPVTSVSNSASGLKVSWKKISGASGYKIYRKTGSETATCIQTISDPETQTFFDKTAASGARYSYYVRSVNGSYRSGYASKSITVVNAPSLSLQSAADGIALKWNAIDGATGYEVYRKVASGSYSCIQKINNGTTLQYQDADVKFGEKYTYYVKAVNGTTKSGYASQSITYQFESGLLLHLVVKDGNVVDMVSGSPASGFTVDGDAIKTGTVTLPKSMENWTLQMVADYNESSKSGIFKLIKFTSNSGKYEECSDVFKLNEVDLISNRGSIRVPWVADSWNSGYTVTVPVQLYAHTSTTYEYLPLGDIFWSFSMDSDHGILNSRINGATASTTMKTYTDSGNNTKYVNKILPSSFALTGEHKVKEIKIYDHPLTKEEQKNAYLATGITAPTKGINQVLNGLTDMGSPLAFLKDSSGLVSMLSTEKTAGTYTVSDDYGKTASYNITDYVHPDLGIDNSKYESVHITNEPDTILVGKQYPLTAYPYPFRIQDENGKADEYDVSWKSSNTDVLAVVDGLLIAKKAGTAEITACLVGTSHTDTVKITVKEKEKQTEKVWNVPSDYKSKNGYTFSKTDYEMTTHAIYDAIDEAAENGYNHIVFPKQDFYAVPLTDANGYAVWYYIPTHMTVEFPKGSTFRMMDNEVSRGDPTKIEIHYFEFGVPNSDYQNVCEDSHLIIDQYYGERYQTTHKESEYLEEMRFVEFGRKAINCSVEIRNAYSPTGYFITADGTCNTNKTSGVMKYSDFISGWLDDNGSVQSNDNWISTKDFISVPDYGKDGYFISADGQDSYAGKYWGGCSARQYDILWFDSQKNLIQTERFLGRGDYYKIPSDASYFKLSLQQQKLPVPASGETENSPWIAMHDDGSAKMCELKNTNVWNSATGLFSVVGETDGLWIHDCFTNRDGMKENDERTGDFENGWTATRHSVVSNNYLYGYFGNPGSYNTFFHTNFIRNYSGFSAETELLRYINNATDYIEISEKQQAHIFNNTIYGIGLDRFNTSIGQVYKANNATGKWVRSY